MKKLTKAEITELLALPNGPEKLMNMNVDLDRLTETAAEMFVVLFVDFKLGKRKFHLAKVDNLVAAVDEHINLKISVSV